MHEPRSCKSVVELFGVPEPPKQGRDRLVATAIELFYRHGFAAVGLDRILAEAGVSKTAFYKHFDSKDALMVAAVRTRDAWEQQAWRRAVRRLAGDDPRAQLRACFQVMDIWFNDPDFQGCMFINAAAEFPNPFDPVHRAAAAHKKAFRSDVRELAIAAGAMESDALADQFTMLFEGALVLRQVYGRDDAARAALPLVDRLLDQWLPAD